MRLIPYFAAGISILAATTALASPQKAPEAVSLQPNPFKPGQTVTLHWLFTGTKVTVSGGRFGKGTVVTGKTLLTDKPTATTRYTFDVWYPDPEKSADSKAGKLLHQSYTVVAQVMPALATYRDTRGWQIEHLKGWKRDNVSLPDPANNALMYFQVEDDSVERLAVSMLPAGDMTVVDLMGKVERSLPNNYDEIEILSKDEVTCSGAPGILATLTGMDRSHPGTRTQSIVLAFVRDRHAYVVSARTSVSSFKARGAILERLVKSIAFQKASAAK
jgi:hypothetical protein